MTEKRDTLIGCSPFILAQIADALAAYETAEDVEKEHEWIAKAAELVGELQKMAREAVEERDAERPSD